MGAYLLRRLLLVVPTLLGIIIINFAVVQFAPGGPVEQMIAELRGQGQTLGPHHRRGRRRGAHPQRRRARGTAGGGAAGRSAAIAARRGSTPAIIAEIEKQLRLRQAGLAAVLARCCQAICASTSGDRCSATGRWWT